MKQLLPRINDQKNAKLAFIIYISVWFVVNLVQAAITELAHDEAYYWLYSRHMEWGFFDHPPMIAFLIKIGTLFSNDELAVRIFPVILGTLSILMLYFLIPDVSKEISLFIALSLSVVIIQSHVGGLLAIPDLPLVFFFLLFLVLYKNYLEKDTVILALLLGITGACMLYSKYHGILVLFFMLISNVKIMSRRSFWIIPVIISVLMLPHLLWQIRNGFPTFEYHLIGRSRSYSVQHTINYVLSQILIAGPFVSIILIFHGFKRKSANLFEKSLKYIMIGFFSFFFLSSFKGHVEAHWTAIAFVALFILAFKGIKESKKARKWTYVLFIPSVIMVVFIRISLVHNIFHLKTNVPHEFLHWDQWASEIESIAGDRDVVFMNTFQRPSKYIYYTHKFATSLNNYHYRKNQFDIWPYEDSVQNENILLIHAEYPEDTLITSAREKYPYKKLDNFRSYYNLPVKTDIKEISGKSCDKFDIPVSIYNPRTCTVDFVSDSLYETTLEMNFYHKGILYYSETCYFFTTERIPSKETLNLLLSVELPKEEGRYQMVIAMKTHELAPAFNSRIIPVDIKN